MNFGTDHQTRRIHLLESWCFQYCKLPSSVAGEWHRTQNKIQEAQIGNTDHNAITRIPTATASGQTHIIQHRFGQPFAGMPHAAKAGPLMYYRHFAPLPGTWTPIAHDKVKISYPGTRSEESPLGD